MGIATWQNRVFAVPPGHGHRLPGVNGYIYISGNPVTDPAKIAERAEFFQKRAGYYFEHWDELYAKWKLKMEALIAEITDLRVPDLPEYEPDEVVFENDRNTALRRGARRLRQTAALQRAHVAAPQRVPAPRLRGLRDLRRLLQGVLPDIPDQHIAQMVAGHRRAPVQAGRRTQASRASRRRHRRRLGVRRGSLAPRDRRRSWRGATPARAGSTSSRR